MPVPYPSLAIGVTQKFKVEPSTRSSCASVSMVWQQHYIRRGYGIQLDSMW